MSEKDILASPTPNIAARAHEFPLTRAKSFKVITPNSNYGQYVRTVRAYALAGMPFEHIANAGEQLGDVVERGELDAPLQEGREVKVGETVEDESKILSWQNRGEVISITHQIASPNPIMGQEVVQTSQDLTIGQNPSQTLNVLEGIAVFNKENNSQLENNPYLKAPADIKKAA